MQDKRNGPSPYVDEAAFAISPANGGIWCKLNGMKWFWQKNRASKLQKAYEKKMQEAMNAQRSGNIQLSAQLNQEAEEILAQIQEEKA